MAAKLSSLDEADVDRLRALVAAAGLPTEPPAIASDEWLAAMGMDKKVRQKQLRFVLLEDLGAAYTTSDYDREALARIIGSSA